MQCQHNPATAVFTKMEGQISFDYFALVEYNQKDKEQQMALAVLLANKK